MHTVTLCTNVNSNLVRTYVLIWTTPCLLSESSSVGGDDYNDDVASDQRQYCALYSWSCQRGLCVTMTGCSDFEMMSCTTGMLTSCSPDMRWGHWVVLGAGWHCAAQHLNNVGRYQSSLWDAIECCPVAKWSQPVLCVSHALPWLLQIVCNRWNYTSSRTTHIRTCVCLASLNFA